jgi:hypothetical protein
MILVRDIFNLKFGKARDAKEIMKEGKVLMKKYGLDSGRAMTDLTGKSYTLVLESQYDNLSDYEKKMQNGLGQQEWKDWYQKFVPLVDSASREIFTILE